MIIHKRFIMLIATLLVLIVLSGFCTSAAQDVVCPPQGYGTLHTYTVWDNIRWGGNCRKLINFAKEHNALSNNHGIVTYGSYFCGALTSTYGSVGDMMLVVEEDNVVYPVIMADTKSQSDKGCNAWGHHNGKCVVEFEILSSHRRSLYGSSGGYISDALAKPIVKVINLGSVYDSIYYFWNPKQACIDNGLEGYKLLTSPYEWEIIEVIQPREILQEQNYDQILSDSKSNPLEFIINWFNKIFTKSV